MADILYEQNKIAGVRYAVTNGGVELPVIDITHPAFSLEVGAAEQQELVRKFMAQQLPLTGWPAPVRKVFFKFALRGSVLAQGIGSAEGTYMSGMHTYLLKLGPKMLGAAYSKPVDGKIAASLPAVGVRLRVQDMARLMAEALAPALSAHPNRPLRLVNIAGGPAIDSLNALILLSRENGAALADRITEIAVLDLDEAGPSFGKAALAALSEQGAPLAGLRILFRHVRYDWSQTAELGSELRKAEAAGAMVICSSEGGLFEYGSDDEIISNLRTLRACPNTVAIVGSVTRADDPMRKLKKMNTAKIIPRGLKTFRALADQAEWKIARAIERPFSDQVVLS